MTALEPVDTLLATHTVLAAYAWPTNRQIRRAADVTERPISPSNPQSKGITLTGTTENSVPGVALTTPGPAQTPKEDLNMAEHTRAVSHDATWDPTWGPEPTADELGEMATLTSADWKRAITWWRTRWPEAEEYGVTKADAIAFIRTAVAKAIECQQREEMA